MENENWTFAPGGAPRQVRDGRGVDPIPPIPKPASVLPSAPAHSPTPAPPVPELVHSQQPGAAPVTNGSATASLVLGIVGIFLPILSILAVIFGGIGISKANQGASGKGMAIAGLVLGILGTLVLISLAANAGR